MSSSEIGKFEVDSDIGHLRIVPIAPVTTDAILYPVEATVEEDGAITVFITIPKRVKELIRVRAIEGMISALYLCETGAAPGRAVVDALTLTYIEEVDETVMDHQYIFDMLKIENLNFFERLNKMRVATLRESVTDRLNDATTLMNLAYFLQRALRVYTAEVDDRFENDLTIVLSVSDTLNSIRG